MTSTPGFPEWRDAFHHLNLLSEAAIRGADPYAAVKAKFQSDGERFSIGDRVYEPSPEARVFLVGAGKAGIPMTIAAAEVLGSNLSTGVVAVPSLPETSLDKIEFIQGGHPLPNAESLRAGARVAELLGQVREGDFVIFLISGGGSALLELPVPGISLDDLHTTNALLIESGAPIESINAIRARLSQLKAGGLLRMSAPGTCIGLILSDVVGDQLEWVASGPTVASKPLKQDPETILRKYELSDRVPEAVHSALRAVRRESFQGEGFNVLIGNNRMAMAAAMDKATEIGFRSIDVSSSLRGEARIMGARIGALAMASAAGMHPDERPRCLVLGGETVVTVHGSGKGGRNQELALAAGVELDPKAHIAILAMATDGIDGPTPAAGAMVTGDILEEARSLGLDPTSYLDENDSYTFFRQAGGLLVTGPTMTNVNDIALILLFA